MILQMTISFLNIETANAYDFRITECIKNKNKNELKNKSIGKALRNAMAQRQFQYFVLKSIA